MIRYESALDGIEAAIEAEAPGWLTRASTRTERYAALGLYTEKYTDPATGETHSLSPFWSEVKPVFMARQFNKCLYCEKKLEGKNYATIEWDLEHFRPKSNVRPWPPSKSTLTYDFPLGGLAESGYFLLAYHYLNYGAACKTCNSPFKSDYFPVAAGRITGQRDPAAYLAEAPYLVYPLGFLDENPEDLIAFQGVRAYPRHERSIDERKWKRGRIMIDFFGLNRDGLIENRAWWLLNAVWPSFLLEQSGDPTGKKRLASALSAKAPFTSCTRCFVELCRSDRATAQSLIPLMEEIVDSMAS